MAATQEKHFNTLILRKYLKIREKEVRGGKRIDQGQDWSWARFKPEGNLRSKLMKCPEVHSRFYCPEEEEEELN